MRFVVSSENQKYIFYPAKTTLCLLIIAPHLFDADLKEIVSQYAFFCNFKTMIRNSIPIFILISFLLFETAAAQNITGIWEGLMSDEFLRVNINQNKNELCGYTYDIVLDNKQSHCKSYFTGKYDSQKGIWTINGIKFIENSGDHILMTLRLWQVDVKNTNLLRGMVSSGPGLLNFFDSESADLFWLKKVSNRPVSPKKGMPICYQATINTSKNPPPSNKTVIKKTPSSQTNNNNTNKKNKIEQNSIDSITLNSPIPPIITSPITIDNDANNYISKVKIRKNNSISDILVQVRKIKIEIYDNGSIDNDSVSIFYNGKMLRTNERLTEKPISIELELDASKEKHELLLFAENVGTYPPNTALIVVTAGKKRFELHSSASLTENAILNIIYQP